MLVRKLKLKFIDNNPAFINDPWLAKNREKPLDTLSRSLIVHGGQSQPRNSSGLQALNGSNFRKSMVSFGNSTLPKIKPT